MCTTRVRQLLAAVLCMAGAVFWAASTASGQGIIVPAGGPVHRGMAGASTAAPLDAIGALYWNPATISGLEHSELEFGLDLLFVNHQVASTVGPASGVTDAEPGAVPLPNIGWVHHTRIPGLTLGLGVNAVAGFKTNLPVDPGNPVLAAPPAGLGPVTSEATFLQLTPVVSYALSESLSIAAGPLVTMASIGVEPFVFDAANGDGTYAHGRASRWHWGGGAQAGIYYIHDQRWHFGASIRSPAWMEEFEFFAHDENGAPRVLRTQLDLPLIVSLGAAYSGFENTVIAFDARFLDYANTDGLGDPAVFDDTTGELQGLDYSSVFALALGVQRKISEQVHIRTGYNFNQNPVKNSEAFFNIASPLIYQHTVNAGASYQLSEWTGISVGYSYMIANTRNGPVVLPGVGPVPGSSFSNQMDGHFVSFGVVMRH